jgi:energy-coupling factor transport system permease protein
MHPLIRFVCFLVIVFFLSLSDTSSLLISIPAVITAWLLSRRLPSAKIWRLLWRLRWLYLSIFVLYGYFTPGQVVINSDLNWFPSTEGLNIALIKMALLIAIVLWADVWFGRLSRDQWVQGIYDFLRPFSWRGFNRERFVLRLLLTMEELQTLQMQSERAEKNDAGTVKQRLKNTATAVKARFLHAVNDQSAPTAIEFELAPPPRWYEWLWPIGLALVFLLASGFID